MSYYKNRFIQLGLLVCSVACGDDGSDAKGNAPLKPVTKENALSRLAGALCDGWFDCPCSERQYSWMNKSTCREVMLERWEGEFANFQMEGYQLDTDCVDAQLEAYRTLGCKSEAESRANVDLLSALGAFDFCHAVTLGLQEGESCDDVDTSHLSLDQCGPGLSCQYDGKCVRQLPGDGEPCADGQCRNGFQCNGTICEVYMEPQSPCGECREDEYCVWLTADMASCQPKSPVGQPCRAGACVNEAYCDYQADLCVAYPAAGQPCADLQNYQIRCVTGTWCQDSVCQPLPGEGEPCAQADTYDLKCAEGLICPYGTSLCQKPGIEGANCQDDSACVEGLVCEDYVCGKAPPLVCN